MPPVRRRVRQSRQARTAARASSSTPEATDSECELDYFEPFEVLSDADDAEQSLPAELDPETFGSEVQKKGLAIGQPLGGWQQAERALGKKWERFDPLRSSRQVRWYQTRLAKKEREETRLLKETYGSISRFFVPSVPTSATGLFFNHPRPDTILPPPLDTNPAGGSLGSCDSHRPDAQYEEDLAAYRKWKAETPASGDWATRVDSLERLLANKVANACRGLPVRRNWVEASLTVAQGWSKGPKFAKALRHWEREWVATRIPPPRPQRGRHTKTASLFNDEGVQIAMREYLNRAMWRASPLGLCRAIRDYFQSQKAVDAMRIAYILSEDPENAPREYTRAPVSERTALRWLIKFGWIYGRDKKGYVDGHERADVVDYRDNIFNPRMEKIFKTLREYNDEGEIPKSFILPEVNDPTAALIMSLEGVPRRQLITHDESTFNAHDGALYSWKKAGCEWLKPKSRGKGLMVSEFLLASQGRLHYISETGEPQYVTEIIRYGSGKSDDGWWNAEKMIAHVRKAIMAFEKSFPDDIAVFAFDNSSGHACKAPDALVANRMNLNPGGKQPCMHDTVTADGRRQSMVFEYGEQEWDPESGFNSNVPVAVDLLGQPKGMKRVLQERGLWRQGMKKQCGRGKKEGKRPPGGNFGERQWAEAITEYEARTADRCAAGKGCCALRVLEAETDFLNEVSLLETVISGAGHEVIFYPKFHCEFNYIEYFWAAVKRYTRANCEYSFTQLESTILSALASVPLITIRRFANRSKRWMMSYINGLTKEQMESAEKEYASHRRERRRINI